MKLSLMGGSATARADNIPHLGIIMSGLMWLSFAGDYLSYLICKGLIFPGSRSASAIEAKAMHPFSICPWLWMKWAVKCSSLLILTCSWALLTVSLQNVPLISAGRLSKSLYFQGSLLCSSSQFLSLVHCLVFWDTALGAACWEFGFSQKTWGLDHPNLSYKLKQIFHLSARVCSVSRCLLNLLWLLPKACIMFGMPIKKRCKKAYFSPPNLCRKSRTSPSA